MANQLPADVNLNSPQIQLINEWHEGFKELNVDILAKCLHKDFHRVVYPRSIGQPEQNKEEWIRDITGIMGFATGFEVGYLPTPTPFPQPTIDTLFRQASIPL